MVAWLLVSFYIAFNYGTIGFITIMGGNVVVVAFLLGNEKPTQSITSSSGIDVFQKYFSAQSLFDPATSQSGLYMEAQETNRLLRQAQDKQALEKALHL